MNLPTDLLRTFVAISELGSFSRAGEALGRSQPAVSLQIKRLEELTGKSLIARSGKRMQTTETGEALLNYARQMLRINDQAVANLLKPRVAGHVRLGIPNEFAISVLPRILARFSEAHPDVTLEVTCDLSTNLLSALNRNEADLVIAIHDDTVTDAERAWTENLVWVASSDHASYDDDPIPLILAPQGCVYRKRIIQTLSQQHREWRIVYTSTSYGGIRAAALAGLGVTALAYTTVPEGLKILTPGTRYPALQPAEVALHYDRLRADLATLRIADYITSSIQPEGLTAGTRTFGEQEPRDEFTGHISTTAS